MHLAAIQSPTHANHLTLCVYADFDLQVEQSSSTISSIQNSGFMIFKRLALVYHLNMLQHKETEIQERFALLASLLHLSLLKAPA